LTAARKFRKTYNPVRLLARASRNWVPPGFHGNSLYDVLKYYAKGFSVPYLTERAAAISYNFIMALPPTCLFIFTLIPSLPFISKKALKHQLHFIITDIIPSRANNQSILQFIDGFIDSSRIGILSFTFVLSLFFASNAVMGIMRSFNKNYIGFVKVKGLRKRWDAIKLTLLLFGLLLACLIMLALQNNFLNLIGIRDRSVRHLILYGRWLIIIALLFYSFAFIYKYAPAVQKRWKLVSPGAVIATCLSIFTTLAFSSFVNNFGRYNILYGSIGSIMIIMIMIFLNSLVILVGFEFNLSINSLKTLSEQRRS